MAQHPEYACAEEKPVDLYIHRHQSICGTRKPRYLILCKDAMTAFARTGRTTAHPFCLRPFTPEERMAILNDLIDQAEHTPCFITRVLREPAAMPRHQLIGCDEPGLLICDTRTDYSLESCSELFLNSLLVASRFKSFMPGVLTRDKTESAAETIGFLRRLVKLV
ncbi:MAG: hypothetical protein J1E43_08190 [Christensenellaceae bacterium]|nr:hypothetical protein [Christensenellaceae bacterium]